MRVRRAGAHVALVQVVGPDRVECGDVPRHAGHEGREQSGETEPQEPRREEVQQQHRCREVVIQHHAAARVAQWSAGPRVELRRYDPGRRGGGGGGGGGDRDGGAGRRRDLGARRPRGRRRRHHQRDHSREDHEKREQQLGKRRDQRGAPRRGHRIRRHGALHDQEIGAPVAEREHEAESHHQPEPLDAYRVVGGVPHERPTAGVGARGVSVGGGDGREPRAQPGPSAHRAQAEEHKGSEAENDQEELQYFIVDGAGQPAEKDVGQHHPGGHENARVEAPAEEQVEELPHGVQGDAGGEHGHRGERHGV